MDASANECNGVISTHDMEYVYGSLSEATSEIKNKQAEGMSFLEATQSFFNGLKSVLTAPTRIAKSAVQGVYNFYDNILNGVTQFVAMGYIAQATVAQIMADVEDIKTTANLFETDAKEKIRQIKYMADTLWGFSEPSGAKSGSSTYLDSYSYQIADLYVNNYSPSGTTYQDYQDGDVSLPPSEMLLEGYNNAFIALQVYAMIVAMIDEIKTAQTTNYSLYKVKFGDTLILISLNLFNDINYSKIIADMNNLTNRDFENDAMVGKFIKIPLLQDFLSQDFLTTNLVYTYEDNFENALKPFTNLAQIEAHYFGVDLKLTEEKGLVLDKNNDLELLSGQSGWVENCIDAVNTPIGELNSLHTDFGVTKVAGTLLTNVISEKFIQNIQNVLAFDPRTKDVQILNKKVEGDTLTYDVELTNILNESFFKNFVINRSFFNY